MIFEQVSIGGDRNFSYLIGDEATGQAALVDPAYTPEKMVERAQHHGLRVTYIINTHSHHDHTNGNDRAKALTGAKIVKHEDAPPPFDMTVADGDELELGNLRLKIIHTPGHSYDGICILVEDKLVTGDTLFVGKVGGTDYGEGARLQHESLHQKLMSLDEDIEVYPGHDVGVKPHSTIGYERQNNPFILQSSLAEFVNLKKNWLAYKQARGIK